MIRHTYREVVTVDEGGRPELLSLNCSSLDAVREEGGFLILESIGNETTADVKEGEGK